jgi:hypothetical protein
VDIRCSKASSPIVKFEISRFEILKRKELRILGEYYPSRIKTIGHLAGSGTLSHGRSIPS